MITTTCDVFDWKSSAKIFILAYQLLSPPPIYPCTLLCVSIATDEVSSYIAAETFGKINILACDFQSKMSVTAPSRKDLFNTSVQSPAMPVARGGSGGSNEPPTVRKGPRFLIALRTRRQYRGALHEP